ncbi:uncharacterized protein LOC123439406 [Hordeum vulgare subsp. vulgare]|uniref:Pectinesterase inhibitor domain-containing protein n=1 Tax=Hordeum vulgare subsp. vulgare TaxID=112509 RepID=A0A8I6WYY7_HORVV|nr:uncharacterized protein LOC123439406 [Hordeum vulgare subsp. vulgare]
MTMSKLILLLVLAPLGMAAASTDCGPPSLPLNASFVCRDILGTDLEDPCIRMMTWGGIDMSAPVPHEEGAIEYVILAAWFAVESLGVTRITARNQRSHNASLSGHEREVYEGCVKDYALAGSSMARVAADILPSCRFDGLRDEYLRVLVSIDRCTDRLPAKTPLHAMVVADRFKAWLAYRVSVLIGL